MVETLSGLSSVSPSVSPYSVVTGAGNKPNMLLRFNTLAGAYKVAAEVATSFLCVLHVQKLNDPQGFLL